MSKPSARSDKDVGFPSHTPSEGDSLRFESFDFGETFDVANATVPKMPPYSGDFHIAIPMEDGTIGLIMGDVVGHGEAAATHANTLCRAIGDCLIEGLPPSEALGFVNAAAEMSTEFEGFATVFAGTVNPDGILTYASGGHEPGLIATEEDGDSEGAAILELDTTGPPLGVLGAEAVHYESRTVSIEDGGTLLLYTDGITEARRGSEILGMARLRRLLAQCLSLPPISLVRKIVGFARAFTGRGRELRDDAALMILRRRKKPAV